MLRRSSASMGEDSMSSSGQPRPQRRRKPVTHYTDDNPSTFTVKRKRGEPAPPSPPPPPPPAAAALRRGKLKPKYTPKKSRKRNIRVVSQEESDSQHMPLKEDCMVAHAVAVHPVLPLPLKVADPTVLQQDTFCPNAPTWKTKLLPYPDRYLPGTNIKLPPVSLTCLHSRVDHGHGFCVGDALGGITLYQNSFPVAFLETSASTREKQRTVTSKKVVTYPNAVETAAWCGPTVVLATADELECIQLGVPQHRIAWTIPVIRGPLRKHCLNNHSIQLHRSERKLLWATWGKRVPGDAVSVPLYRISWEESKATREPIVPEGWSIDSFNCFNAIWDQSSENHVLVVAHQAEAESGCLLRLNESGSVTMQSELPIGARGSQLVDASLTQRPGDAQYTCLAFARGIRLYETATLACLQVYGESVAIHGKTVHWQTALWVPEPRYDLDQLRGHKRDVWLQYEDVLAKSEPHGSSRYLIVGVPHPFKGPAELNSTLHVWKSETMDPPVTLTAPPGGHLGCVITNRHDRGWSIWTASPEGAFLEYSPSFESNFAGNMYPVNYRVIRDNVEYIEDEDELDQVIVVEDENTAKHSEMSLDTDLQEALRRSLMEKDLENEAVDVLDDKSETSYHVATWPAPKVAEQDDDPDHPNSPTRERSSDGFDADVLGVLPQLKQVKEKEKLIEERRMTLLQSMPNDEAPAGILPPRIRGKRTKTANVEALLKVSVKSDLRLKMGELQKKWSNGRGSELDFTQPKEPPPLPPVVLATAEEKEVALELLLLSPTNGGETEENTKTQLNGTKPTDVIVTPHEHSPPHPPVPLPQICNKSKHDDDDDDTEEDREIQLCMACRGRMVIHSCGKREKPVDYEAIERAERERKQREAEEKQRLRVEKRRQADARRREARKKKKEEEELKRAENERILKEKEERMLRLEEEQFERAHIRERVRDPIPPTRWSQPHVDGYEPSFSPLNRSTVRSEASAFDRSDPDYERTDNASQERDTLQSSGHGYSSISAPARSRHEYFDRSDSYPSEQFSTGSWYKHAVRSTTPSESAHSSNGFSGPDELIRLDGNEVTPSTSLSTNDALAALAGLADSISFADERVSFGGDNGGTSHALETARWSHNDRTSSDMTRGSNSNVLEVDTTAASANSPPVTSSWRENRSSLSGTEALDGWNDDGAISAPSAPAPDDRIVHEDKPQWDRQTYDGGAESNHMSFRYNVSADRRAAIMNAFAEVNREYESRMSADKPAKSNGRQSAQIHGNSEAHETSKDTFSMNNVKAHSHSQQHGFHAAGGYGGIMSGYNNTIESAKLAAEHEEDGIITSSDREVQVHGFHDHRDLKAAAEVYAGEGFSTNGAAWEQESEAARAPLPRD